MNVVDDLLLPGLGEALGRIEVALRSATATEDPFLTEVTGHLVDAGGKRLRPALAVAAATLGSGAMVVSDEVVQGSVAVELVHLGSLYHDDVMDEATRRRGVESVNSRWGNLIAVLAGDFLLARASEIAASLGTEVAGLLASTIGHLCEGELSQLRWAFNTDRPETSYFTAISGKTASLMATSARVGAIVAGAPRPSVKALTDYGHALGMSFQIWDDIRDLVSSEDDLGKPVGQDVVEGTYTLPVIRALAVEGVGTDLRNLLGKPLDRPALDKARDLVGSSGVLTGCAAEARLWAERADAALDVLRVGLDGDELAGQRLALLGRVGHRLLDELDLGP